MWKPSKKFSDEEYGYYYELDSFNTGYTSIYESEADTPEDAACKLAIELWKQGVLR